MTSAWVGKLVRLRAVEPEDWEVFRELDQNTVDERRGSMIRPPRSAARKREWAEQTALKQDDDTFVLAIETLAAGVLVGTVSTALVDRRAGRFMYGIALGSEHHRRGYATDAVPLLLNFMFGERRFHKCEAGVWAFNEPSLALQRKLGFTEEGRLRDHEFFAGRHHDVVLFGMTAPEFAARHPFPSEL
ncbi:GNAT family N-acetyltransferase [Lentzea flava]|uniref:N-acetyltransferase n=1 Tax=Lentzea flava TaxID=103732 RepID=A0ABQ2UKE6_9PSEU|nr:GNAT family protein [Lentzea flava]MCP2199683.1 Protein N-acetyltransferase, RimJ/RimL family [Lentzea flava]GGU39044.1 N-acetyltransferase [Lentzea flava]